MGVARFPGTAANSFRIDSQARPRALRGRAFIEELPDSPVYVLARDYRPEHERGVSYGPSGGLGPARGDPALVCGVATTGLRGARHMARQGG